MTEEAKLAAAYARRATVAAVNAASAPNCGIAVWWLGTAAMYARIADSIVKAE